MEMKSVLLLAASLLPLGIIAAPAFSTKDISKNTCRRTKVAIIGAGVAGITAAVSTILYSKT